LEHDIIVTTEKKIDKSFILFFSLLNA